MGPPGREFFGGVAGKGEKDYTIKVEQTKR